MLVTVVAVQYARLWWTIPDPASIGSRVTATEYTPMPVGRLVSALGAKQKLCLNIVPRGAEMQRDPEERSAAGSSPKNDILLTESN